MTVGDDNPHGLVSEDWRSMDMNLPLQAYDNGKTVTFQVYMPRRLTFFETDGQDRNSANLVARDSAKLLRNLAALMDAFADGKINHVYYPDKLVEDAIKNNIG